MDVDTQNSGHKSSVDLTMPKVKKGYKTQVSF